jgi:two-component system nitrogen regulation sensor histidine kinase NtrY
VTRHDTRLGVVRLEIADDGAGMTPEAKARLFEPYFSTKPDGTGLGLAIVSAIVADHNGFIRVRDNLPRGSRFVLEFPVRRRAAQLAARAQHGAYAGA